MYRICSIDGGGVYGALEATLIHRLVKAYPKFLDNVDLLAGSSIGGIMALGYAADVPVEKVTQFFEQYSSSIFAQSTFRKLFAKLGITCRYNNQNLRNLLNDLFGDMKLGDLKKKVIITAFQVNSDAGAWKAKFFHNFPGSDSDGDTPVLDAAMATSAAPVFFPSWGWYIDGGVVESNPSMAAVAQTQDARSDVIKPSLEEIHLVSIGRDSTRHCLEQKNISWGFLNWAMPILNMVMDRDSRVIHYQCEKMLGQRYHRLSPVMTTEQEFGIDDYNAVPSLINIANDFDLSKIAGWLDSVKW